jgi:carboxyl-terminal processing protease
MVEEFEAELEGQFGGLGISITFDGVEKAIRVEQPIVGTPAFEAELRSGDLIVKIREESTGVVTKTEDFETVHDAVSVLRGEPGTKVTITVISGDTGKKRNVTITREIITIPGVRAVEMADPEHHIGYVYVPYFSKRMVEDLASAIRDLKEQGAKGLVLDMRFNPGGLLSEARACANLFLDRGVIVKVKGRKGTGEMIRARRGKKYRDLSLVLLVNRYSASGAEIVAAALRDHGRAVVVGEPTFGKASVQTLIDNPHDGSAIKLTIARYYTPKGELIEETGVKPDIEVTLSDEDMARLPRHLGRKTEYPPRPPEEAAPEVNDTGEAEPEGEEEEEEFHDIQLERAVDVLREVLAGRAIGSARRAVAAPAG